MSFSFEDLLKADKDNIPGPNSRWTIAKVIAGRRHPYGLHGAVSVPDYLTIDTFIFDARFDHAMVKRILLTEYHFPSTLRSHVLSNRATMTTLPWESIRPAERCPKIHWVGS